MDTRAADRLLFVYFTQVMNIETKEVNDLASGIYFGLVSILTLPQHGRSIHVRAVLCCNQVIGFQKNVRPVLPTHSSPSFFGSKRCIDCLLYMFLIPFMIIS